MMSSQDWAAAWSLPLGGDQGVYFVDGAVGDQREFVPATIMVAVGGRGAGESEGLSFPGECRFGDALPALGEWQGWE
jgi:hypothetical protein